MRKIVSICSLLLCMVLWAEDKTIIVVESSLPYTNQTWFHDTDISEIKTTIKKNWDEGRRITSAAYTSNGWFVTMAKNSGLTGQSYKFSSSWPKEWIAEKKKEGRLITSCTYGDSQWLVVVSENTGYTAQTWIRDEWSEVKSWIDEHWNRSYYITGLAYNGSYWTVVMSKTSEITDQGYLWASTTDELKEKIQKKVWDLDYNIQLLNYEEFVFGGLLSICEK